MSTRSPTAVADRPFERSAIARSTRDLLAAEPIARIRKVDASRVLESGLGVADDTLRALLERTPIRRRRSRRRPIALGVGLLVGILSVAWIAASLARRSVTAPIRRDEAEAFHDEAVVIRHDELATLADDGGGVVGDDGPWSGDAVQPSHADNGRSGGTPQERLDRDADRIFGEA